MTLKQAIFIDTWGWLALSHRQDHFHQQVKQIYLDLRQQNIPIYTSYYVLDELISRLFKRAKLFVIYKYRSIGKNKKLVNIKLSKKVING